jgi:hypothetical protein
MIIIDAYFERRMQRAGPPSTLPSAGNNCNNYSPPPNVAGQILIRFEHALQKHPEQDGSTLL